MKNRKPQKPGSRPAPPRGKRPPRKHGERDARPESRTDERGAKPFRRREDGPRKGPGPGRPGLPKEERGGPDAKPEQTRGRRQQRVEKSAEARANAQQARPDAKADGRPEKPYGKPHGARADKRPKSRADSRNEHRSGAPQQLWVYGRHAVVAALKNPDRPIKRVLATPSGAEFLRDQRVPQERLVNAASSTLEAIDAVLHEGAVHQGLAAMVGDIPRARLKETCAPDGTNRPVLVLDQITDPQNIGAIFRSAAAFRARAIIVQDRRTPPLAGALA
ncbi:MAG: TrmH family RNA methyltransferase, partial [Amphiplicatus sp.]